MANLLCNVIPRNEFFFKLHIVQNARYIVCTASSAVRLQKKVAREVIPSIKETDILAMLSEAPASSGTVVHNAVGAVSALARKFGSLLHVACGGQQKLNKRATQRDATSEAEAEVKELLDFKCVVLDEAGVMLEPDIVCSRVFCIQL